MMKTIIKNLIKKYASKSDILVLKGFPISTIQELSIDFALIDATVYDKGLIILHNINPSVLLSQIMALTPSQKGIMCYESFIEMTSMFRNLSILGKSFCIVTNNLLSNYPNPTDQDIPDFDSS